MRYQPATFFALRTPLLPLATFLQWSSNLQAAQAGDQLDALTLALNADRTQLVQGLQALVAQPLLGEALFVAAPMLASALARRQTNPVDEKEGKTLRTLVRYLAQMAGSVTPYGLFSGNSLGVIEAQATRRQGGRPARREEDKSAFILTPSAAYRRQTSLDIDYLSSLCDALGRDPMIRARLCYFPNPALYRLAGQLRYDEVLQNGAARAYQLVMLAENEYLTATLQRAEGGAPPAALANALVAADPEIDLAEAQAYIDQLIDSQVLVSRLAPTLTGRPPLAALIDTLAEVAPQPAAHLRTINEELIALDEAALGVDPARYLALAAQVERLPAPVKLGQLFQVDLFKPAVNLTIGGALLTELQNGIDLLHRLVPTGADDGLTRFRQQFVARYQDRQMPLLAVLDGELGIGFGNDQNPDAAPLLAGLNFSPPLGQAMTYWGERQQWWLRKVTEAWRTGAQQINLSDADVTLLTNPNPQPLPAAFALTCRVAAPSQRALDQGQFSLLVEGISGPSGARAFGRFCHGDPALQAQVAAYLAAEAAHDPTAIYAEVVHLPAGGAGNGLCRPCLRQYEIPYLGQSGAAPDDQIPVSDLLVAVVNDEIVLYSQRLQRRVIPRLTATHNFALGSQAVYLFLCSLQTQGVIPALRWEWGTVLESADFLPRLTYQRLVLARARWRVNEAEINQLCQPLRIHLGKRSDVERFRRVQVWRKQRQLPRFVVLSDLDQEQLIDLENILSLESLLDTLKTRRVAMLTECFPGADELCVTGPEGAFVHELAVPFARVHDKVTRWQSDKATLAPPVTLSAPDPLTLSKSSFPPGSDWLYAKLYCGVATADRVLCQVIAPVVRAAIASGAADRWFFTRAGDPDWHLRLSVHGEPARLLSEVLPHLHELTAPWLAEDGIWRLQLDTYHREVTRYGGVVGMELAEQLFYIDSEVILALIEQLAGDAGADARWRLTYAGLHLLLDDLGFDLAAKQASMDRLLEPFQAELPDGSLLRHQLSNRYRRQGAELMQLLDPTLNEMHPHAPGLALLRERSAALRPLVSALGLAAARGQLHVAVADLAALYLPLHANRLLRSAHHQQELVLYYLLNRYYISQQHLNPL